MFKKLARFKMDFKEIILKPDALENEPSTFHRIHSPSLITVVS